MTAVTDINNVVLIAILLASFAFCATYAYLAPWYRSWAGRTIMGLVSTNVIVFFWWVVWKIFRFSPTVTAWIRLGVDVYVLACLISLIVLLFRVQILGRGKRRRGAPLVDSNPSE